MQLSCYCVNIRNNVVLFFFLHSTVATNNISKHVLFFFSNQELNQVPHLCRVTSQNIEPAAYIDAELNCGLTVHSCALTGLPE